MNRLFFLVVLAYLPFLAANGRASDLAAPVENQPLPPGFALNRAPAFAEWTVTYIYASDKTGPKPGAKNATETPRLQKLKVTKTNAIYHEEKFFSNGTQRESWHMGNMQFSIDPRSGKLAMYDPSSFGRSFTDIGYNPEVYTDYSKSDFPGLEWISPNSYRGVQKIKDVDYLLFQQGNSSETNPTLARVDPDTHLPVQVQDAQVTCDYQFGPPPQTVQTLPPEIQAQLDKRAELIKKLTTRVPSY